MAAPDDEGQAATTPRAGSYAALEQRVARLERQQDNLTTTVNVMAVDVAVTRAKLESVESSIGNLSSSIEKAMSIIQASISDASTTPAGKAIQAAIEHRDRESDLIHQDLAESVADLKGEFTVVKDEATKNRVWIAAVGGAVTILAFITNLFAPAIRTALGL